MQKTIRVWNGNQVIAVLSVDQNGGSTFAPKSGGAHDSTTIDIEIDPFEGLIVDHSVRMSPRFFRAEED